MKFKKEFTVAFRDVDKHGNIKTSSIVDFMQETARGHATVLEIDYEEEDSAYYWIILRTKVNLFETPHLGDEIYYETHYSGLDKLFAVREFHVFNKENKEIGNITGYYLLMDHGKSRPVRIKENEKISIADNDYEGEKVGKLLPSTSECVKTITRSVYSSDIDGNGHMNNANYVGWCFDMYERNELDAREVESFQIQYVKEMLEGQEIEVCRYMDNCIVGKMDETIHFVAQIIFKKM